MKNTGLKNEELLKDLQRDGSSAVKPRNEFGVYLFDEADLKDGIVFSKLSKPKYIESELLKSIDTNITELLPITASELPPTILLEIYNEVTSSLSSSLSENDELKEQILGLSASLSELESEMDELLIINDSLNLNTAVAENTLQLVNVRLASNVEDLQNAIQRATNESISRAELQAEKELLDATNRSLKQEITVLRTQLDTLIGLGLRELEDVNDANSEDTRKGQFLIAPVTISDRSRPPIFATQRYKGTRTTDNDPIQFSNGQKLRITNLSTKTPLNVNVRKGSTDANWINVSNIKISVPANESLIINLPTLIDWVRSNQNNKNYDSSLIFRSQTGFEQILNTKIIRKRK